ncbi:MAG: tRNA (N6-isopentenyl adenosine(37)-C2)-methylthiotransferase MiaB [Pelagibacteraceae bacterium]|nr:tRNA (N6-isopentenyl adenosine(37)-C2)-methylthiotransferase MiaB [Pelagibacteraceae bacterium]|tara:strand:- start:1845 stop:3161 length:1317 start_codon:yes stop_codon:yes gene_type:complete
MNNSKSFFIKSFGCQMNIYDSDKMRDIFISHGMSQANHYEHADYVVLNTCHIREKATEKTYSDLGRVNKKGKINNKIIVTGCVAQAEGDLIRKRVPFVDLVLGPQSLQTLDKYLSNEIIEDKTITEFDAIEKFDSLKKFPSYNSSSSAFLTIQEGCDKFCTFCVVPYTRGSEYSRRIDDILFEAKNMANSGAVEITLLGQNVNAYHGEDKNGTQRDLTYLINKISEIEKIKRITYSTSHPNNMTDKLIELHGSNEKLLPFLHLPVQSGSNKILKLMNRKHTREFYFGIIDKIKKQKKDIALSSDFIIGFPGEEEKDFDDTIDLIEQVEFMNSYSFIYSPRPGTPAADRKQVSLKIQEERLKIAQSLLNEQQKNFNKKFLKKTLEVLISSSGKYEGQVKGRSEFNQSVAIEGNSKYIGNIVPVNITDVSSHSLIGKTKS